ncbi:MAG: hypothetical protein EHM38_05325 [Geobacteraceae bacterium]|jgi:hypothetical protein|nr:MAG: hypothetical protein EHM38_05325 [Geobacteraceae bacterium]
MKKLIIVACCLVLSACARNRENVPYVPNPNINEPTKIIERVIKHQPAVYITVPYEVSAKSDCIEMRITEPGSRRKSPGDVANTICYQNIGRIVLNKGDIWYVEIIDRLGNWMYYVYSFDESEAKLFIDAMYTMMGKQ